MIFTRIMGGLGNQMFEYAVGKNLSISRNTGLKLDLTWFEDQTPVDTPRHLELDLLRTNYEIAEKNDLPQILPEGVPSKILRKLHILTKPKENRVFNEVGFGFNPEVLALPDNTLLVGYWQCEKYFYNIREKLIEEFKPRAMPSQQNTNLIIEMGKLNSVSLHIRRGDYVTNPNASSFHGIAQLDFYFAAVSDISKKVGLPHFYVFSDDPDWCKENIKIDAPVTFVTHNIGSAAYWDMVLMSKCKHNIIANSSFSWWGAWLNTNPNKRVYAPKKWFNDPSINTADIIPDSWIRL